MLNLEFNELTLVPNRRSTYWVHRGADRSYYGDRDRYYDDDRRAGSVMVQAYKVGLEYGFVSDRVAGQGGMAPPITGVRINLDKAFYR